MAKSKTPKNSAIIGSKKGSRASLKGWIPSKGWANAIMKAVIPKGKVSVTRVQKQRLTERKSLSLYFLKKELKNTLSKLKL